MIEKLREVKIELIKKLTLQDVHNRTAAQFESMFMDLETNNASRTWKLEFNSKMIQLFEDKFTYTILTPEDFDYTKVKVLRIIEKKRKKAMLLGIQSNCTGVG